MYESRHHPLAPRHRFVSRMAASALLGTALIGVSLAIGMAGYHHFEGLAWIDAFVNAAMLLSGMGPLAQPQSEGGKLFAGLYAIYCGLALIAVTAIIFAPVVHRFLHRFHLEQTRGE